MTILGISAYYHDSAAAIIKDGEIVGAVQEERFSRIKNDNEFPSRSVAYCLEAANCTLDDLDAVVYYEKPFLKFERLLESHYTFAPKGISSFIKSIPVWLKDKLHIKTKIRKELGKIQAYDKKKLLLLFPEHHLSHAASAFYPSPFSEAAILTIDGVGEMATTTISRGTGNKIEVLKELHFPHSVGLLYSAFTYYLGFTVNSDEYKLMGLAPYGNPGSAATKKIKDIIKNHLVTVFDDGSIQMNQRIFSYGYGLRMLDEKKMEKQFGFRRRKPEDEFEQQHLDCAFAIQELTEEIMIRLARHAKELTQSNNLCLAGGVALNCVANGKIQHENIFDSIFIQPAAGDAGGALGAALAGYHIYFDKALQSATTSSNDKMKSALLGPSYSDDRIEQAAKKLNAVYRKYDSQEQLCDEAAGLIEAGNVIGWFQGRMEFGPRALGNRSILADPRNPEMQKKLNLKIKFRESFRPFAPAVLEEDAPLYFETHTPSPYMLLVHQVNKDIRNTVPASFPDFSWQHKLYTAKSKLPSITHVDFSARIQTVTENSNPLFHQLLTAFKKRTGYGLLINTSFNIKDEPIVCTPEEAYSCFIKTGMDFLIMGNYLFSKV